MASPKQKTDFIKMIGPLAQKVCKEKGYGDPQVFTCIAQACCESAYGTSKLMKNANAFFGIKATPKWVKAAKYGGKVYNTKTKECYDGKNYVTITDCFRAYDTPEDSVRDYFDLIASVYPSSLKATTVEYCIKRIKDGGYATAPNYVSTILSFYKSSKDLIDSYSVGISSLKNQSTKTEPVKSSTRPTLRNGSIGEDVKFLHKKLREFKYGVREDDFIFGDLTELCVRNFQKSHGLTVDGIVGPKTWKLLEE